MKLKRDIDSLGISLDTLMLLSNSRDVVIHIAGYTAKKYLKINITGSIDMEYPDHEYLKIVN